MTEDEIKTNCRLLKINTNKPISYQNIRTLCPMYLLRTLFYVFIKNFGTQQLEPMGTSKDKHPEERSKVKIFIVLSLEHFNPSWTPKEF